MSSYDRLYFDANRDLDLTNDPVLKPMKDPPWQALPIYSAKERMAFELANIDVDYGPGIGVRPFRIFPWFTVREEEKHPSMIHFAATVARKGTIRIGKDEYDALLAQQYVLTGRFDRPIDVASPHADEAFDDSVNPSGLTPNLLSSMQRSGDQLYTIAATPLGDKLTVKPYRGDFGVFRIGPGEQEAQGRELPGFVPFGDDLDRRGARPCGSRGGCEEDERVQAAGRRLSAFLRDDRIRPAANRPVRQLPRRRPASRHGTAADVRHQHPQGQAVRAGLFQQARRSSSPAPRTTKPSSRATKSRSRRF